MKNVCQYKNYSYQLLVPYIIYAGFEAITESICDALLDLVSFAQFKKLEKHPCRSLTFSKVAGTKSRNASHMH